MFERKKLRKEVEGYLLVNQQSLYRLAFSYVKNQEDALDIVQESILKAISSVDSLEKTLSIKTWVYRIVVNTSLDFLRKQKRLGFIDDEVLGRCDSGTVIDNYPNLDLAKALEQLPHEDRSRIILRFYEDLRIEDVADILNENVNTAKSRLYSTLRKLRLQMEDEI